MRLKHVGRTNEVLSLDGQEIAHGQEFEVGDERGEQLLAEQAVALERVDDAPAAEPPAETDTPAPGEAMLDVQTDPETELRTRLLAVIGPQDPATADPETPREAGPGEAQSTEGDAV